MIPETMNLEALLEKTTDAGLLRDMSAHPQSCRLRVSSPALGPDISMGISRDDRIMLAGIAPTSTVHLLLTACLPLGLLRGWERYAASLRLAAKKCAVESYLR